MIYSHCVKINTIYADGDPIDDHATCLHVAFTIYIMMQGRYRSSLTYFTASLTSFHRTNF